MPNTKRSGSSYYVRKRFKVRQIFSRPLVFIVKVIDVTRQRPPAGKTNLSEVMGALENAASRQATSVDRRLIPNQPKVPGNLTPSSPPERTDSARVIHRKTPSGSYRSSIRRSIVDVRSRLIALWHQSLRDKSRGWTPFSNSAKWQRENISYTATTSH